MCSGAPTPEISVWLFPPDHLFPRKSLGVFIFLISFGGIFKIHLLSCKNQSHWPRSSCVKMYRWEQYKCSSLETPLFTWLFSMLAEGVSSQTDWRRRNPLTSDIYTARHSWTLQTGSTISLTGQTFKIIFLTSYFYLPT